MYPHICNSLPILVQNDIKNYLDDLVPIIQLLSADIKFFFFFLNKNHPLRPENRSYRVENDFFSTNIALRYLHQAEPFLIVILHLLPTEGFDPLNCAFYFSSDDFLELESFSDEFFARNVD